MIFVALFALSFATLDGGVADSGPSDADAGFDAGPVVYPMPPGFARLNVVEDCGLIPNDGLSDGPAFLTCQAELVALGGGELYFPCGVYDSDDQPSGTGTYGYYGFPIDSGVKLVGERQSCTILSSSSASLSNRVVGTAWVGNRPVVDSGIFNMTLMGARSACVAGVYQAHGVFVINATRFEIVNVTASNVTGDGFYFSHNNQDLSYDGLTAVDFCRNAATANSGALAPTSTGLRIRNLVSVPAPDAPFGYDFDAESGINDLELSNSDMLVVHLGGVFGGNIHDNVIRVNLIGYVGADVRVHHNRFLDEGNRGAINCDHCGRYQIEDNTFACGSGGGNGTCIYLNNTFGDDTGSSVSRNIFTCHTPPCRTPLLRINAGDHFTMNGNKVLGPGWTEGFLNDNTGSAMAIGNIVEATTSCFVMAATDGLHGPFTATLNRYVGCDHGVKLGIYPGYTQKFPAFLNMNEGNP